MAVSGDFFPASAPPVCILPQLRTTNSFLSPLHIYCSSWEGQGWPAPLGDAWLLLPSPPPLLGWLFSFLENPAKNTCTGGSHRLGSHRVTSQVPVGWGSKRGSLCILPSTYQRKQQLPWLVEPSPGCRGSRMGQVSSGHIQGFPDSSCWWSLHSSTMGKVWLLLPLLQLVHLGLGNAA